MQPLLHYSSHCWEGQSHQYSTDTTTDGGDIFFRRMLNIEKILSGNIRNILYNFPPSMLFQILWTIDIPSEEWLLFGIQKNQNNSLLFHSLLIWKSATDAFKLARYWNSTRFPILKLTRMEITLRMKDRIWFWIKLIFIFAQTRTRTLTV